MSDLKAVVTIRPRMLPENMTSDMIDRMRMAMEQATALGPAPLREYRMHPDDYQELRDQCEPFLRFKEAACARNMFAGVRIVVDEKAERLPRLKSI